MGGGWWSGVCVCVWKGVVSTRLTGLDEPRPLKYTLNGIHIYLKDNQLTVIFFRLSAPISRHCQSTSFGPFCSSRKGGTTVLEGLGITSKCVP